MGTPSTLSLFQLVNAGDMSHPMYLHKVNRELLPGGMLFDVVYLSVMGTDIFTDRMAAASYER